MPAWPATSARRLTVVGLGPGTATLLGIERPALGALDAQPIAALVGVARCNRDRGPCRGKPTCWGGRAAVRSGLAMAVQSAIRCNPPIRAFDVRLRAAGTPKAVAQGAGLRQRLTIRTGMRRTATDWDRHPFQPTTASA